MGDTNRKIKDHIHQTQQSFNSIHNDITILGRHVSSSIKSSSGPQVIDPDIQKFNALWDPQRLQKNEYTL
jgi:hypothetical protein